MARITISELSTDSLFEMFYKHFYRCSNIQLESCKDAIDKAYREVVIKRKLEDAEKDQVQLDPEIAKALNDHTFKIGKKSFKKNRF